MKSLGTNIGQSGPASAEHALCDAVRRAGRGGPGQMAVVLHLSRMIPPAPRAHHKRIAKALLQDTALRHEGQVFTLADGDMVLLCRAGISGPSLSQRPQVAHPTALPDILGRLLRVDTPGDAEVVSIWPLASHALRLLNYAEDRLRKRVEVAALEDDFTGQTSVLDAVEGLVGSAVIGDMMQRQTAVHLVSGTQGGPPGLQPLFREVTFSIAAIEARTAAGPVDADPFLFRHLAAQLDQRMLAFMRSEIGRNGPLDASLTAADGRTGLHLNLTLPGILSPAFASFAAASSKARLGIEVSLIEAVADPEAFERARRCLAEAGMQLVVDGVSYLSLLICEPAALRPDLLKLEWSPRLVDLPQTEKVAVDAALARIRPERVVLHRAETEASVQWGLSRGLRRFQGRYVDAMLGASRIVGCAHAGGCALRQCIERAGATGQAGRKGCLNPALLDGRPSAKAVTTAPVVVPA